MKTQHTQGEWGVMTGTGRFLISSNLPSTDKNSICATAEDTPTDEANAKLIASAPELLEALKMWQRFCDVGEMPTPSEIGFMDQAIKKATQ